MYNHITLCTSTQTNKHSEHQRDLNFDLAKASEKGWELVSATTVIRGVFTETLTFWRREAVQGQNPGDWAAERDEIGAI